MWTHHDLLQPFVARHQKRGAVCLLCQCILKCCNLIMVRESCVATKHRRSAEKYGGESAAMLVCFGLLKKKKKKKKKKKAGSQLPTR
jgi:hypothetical protein